MCVAEEQTLASCKRTEVCETGFTVKQDCEEDKSCGNDGLRIVTNEVDQLQSGESQTCKKIKLESISRQTETDCTAKTIAVTENSPSISPMEDNSQLKAYYGSHQLKTADVECGSDAIAPGDQISPVFQMNLIPPFQDDAVQHSPVFSGTMQAGGYPSGTTLVGGDPMQAGGDPSGTMQAGGDPSGTMQTGGYPSETMQAGGYPSETMQAGGDPSGTMQAGGDPCGTMQAGGDPCGTMQAGGDPCRTMQAGGDPCGTMQAGRDLTQAGGDPSGTMQAGDPSGTTQAGGDPMQAGESHGKGSCKKRGVSVGVQCLLNVKSSQKLTTEDKSTQTHTATYADNTVQVSVNTDTEEQNIILEQNPMDSNPSTATNEPCNLLTKRTTTAGSARKLTRTTADEDQVITLRKELDSMQNTVIWQALMLRLYGMH